MIDGVCPFCFTHFGSRTCATVYIALAFMLCWKPSVCPTSCATTKRTSSPMRSSGSGSRRARIEWSHLHEVPVLREVLHVVINLDVRFEDFARARIVDVRSDRVL